MGIKQSLKRRTFKKSLKRYKRTNRYKRTKKNTLKRRVSKRKTLRRKSFKGGRPRYRSTRPTEMYRWTYGAPKYYAETESWTPDDFKKAITDSEPAAQKTLKKWFESRSRIARDPNFKGAYIQWEAGQAQHAARQAEVEQHAARRVEEARQARQRAEAAQQARQGAEADRLAKQQAEADRLAKQQAAADRLAKQQAETDRLAKLQGEAKIKNDQRIKRQDVVREERRGKAEQLRDQELTRIMSGGEGILEIGHDLPEGKEINKLYLPNINKTKFGDKLRKDDVTVFYYIFLEVNKKYYIVGWNYSVKVKFYDDKGCWWFKGHRGEDNKYNCRDNRLSGALSIIRDSPEDFAQEKLETIKRSGMNILTNRLSGTSGSE